MKLTSTQPAKYALVATVLAAGLLAGTRPTQAASPQTVTTTAFPGADGTYLPSGFSITAGSGVSSNTLTFTSSDGTDIYRHNASPVPGSSTVFPTGAQLIETVNETGSPNGPLTIDFSKPVDGFSFTAQDYTFDHETFSYTVFSGTTSETYTTSADNTSTNGAGVHLSAFDPDGITSVEISSASDQAGGSNDFYVGPITFLNSSPVPEASTSLSLGVMLALGGMALAFKRRSRRPGGTS